MGALEEKKAKLGVTKIGAEKQKELFDDFVNVGGKVVEIKGDPKNHLNSKLENWIQTREEEERRAQIEEERRRQEEAARKRQEAAREHARRQAQEEASRARENTGPTIGSIKQSVTDVTRDANPTPDFFSRLAAKIVCIIYGIFNFWGNKFSRNFYDYNLIELQNSLLEIRTIMVSLLHQDKPTSAEIRRRLANTGFPYYYELVYRFDQLYDEAFFQALRDARTGPEPIKMAKPHFIRMFKRILTLNRYHPSLKSGLERALQEEKTLRGIDDSTISSNLRKLNRSHNFIFSNYYPKVVNLIDFYYKDDLYQGKKITFRDMLAVSEEDSIGYLTRIWHEEEEREKLRQEQEERQRRFDEEKRLEEERRLSSSQPQDELDMNIEMSNLPNQVKNGLKIIHKNISFHDVLAYYIDNKDPRMVFPPNDKVFITSSLVEFFDREFSFLFVGSSVLFNVFSEKGYRRDLRSSLKDLYFQIDEVIYKRINEYLKIVLEIKKIGSNNYMHAKEQYAQMSQLGLQRSQISRALRLQSSKLLEGFAKQFQIILEDYEHDKRIIQNPEEILTFDTKILGKRFTHKQRVIEIFVNAYYTASALAFLLGDGELGGSGVSLNTPIYLQVEKAEGQEWNTDVQ